MEKLFVEKNVLATVKTEPGFEKVGDTMWLAVSLLECLF